MTAKRLVPNLLGCTLGLAVLLAQGAWAGGTAGLPHAIDAKMNRLQAQQNYAAGRRCHDGMAGGFADPRTAAGGTGNLTIGDFSQSNNRGLREVNILVDGDIINLSKGH
jgi:hypothetical protein